MDIFQLIDNMSNELYLRLKHAAETGKWPEGTPVDKAQRESALQLSMAYQAKHLNADQMLSIGSDGEIVTKTKRQLKNEFSHSNRDAEITPCHKDDTQNNNDIARFTDI
ncbi:YeaC family protein [Colwelliaceae bacterium 6441]